MPVIDEGLMEGGLKEKEGLPEVTEEAWTLREDMAEARASMEVVSALTSALASAWKRPMTFNPPMFCREYVRVLSVVKRVVMTSTYQLDDTMVSESLLESLWQPQSGFEVLLRIPHKPPNLLHFALLPPSEEHSSVVGHSRSILKSLSACLLAQRRSWRRLLRSLITSRLMKSYVSEPGMASTAAKMVAREEISSPAL